MNESRNWLTLLAWITLFLSAVLLTAGFFVTEIGAVWGRRRALEMLAMVSIVAVLAWAFARVLRWRPCNGLLMLWTVLGVAHIGILPVLSAALLSAAALGLGAFFTHGLGRGRWMAAWLIGLLMVGGTLGWLLPWPLHWQGVYGALLLGIALWRYRVLQQAWRESRAAWRLTIRRAPVAAFAAMCLAGAASIALWLPTIQFDDLGYHLLLPTQLLEQHYYRLDAASHIWALAPWLGDVLQAVVAVAAGTEGRGAMNGVWLVLLLYFVWAMMRTLGLAHRERWLAVALAASQPMLFALLGGMQMELPLTVFLLAAVTFVLRDKIQAKTVGASRPLLPLMLLTAGLLALKASAVVWALPLAAWALWGRSWYREVKILLVGLLCCALWVGSSYFYATAIAGNPLLPLFNDIFQSPYITAERLVDGRWFAGIDMALPWNLVFHTGRFIEGHPGAIGFCALGLLGGALLAILTSNATRALFVFTLVAFFGMFVNIQYVRYVFPVLTLLIPLALAGYGNILKNISAASHPKTAIPIFFLLAALNVAFYPNAWYGYQGKMLWPVFTFQKGKTSIRHEYAQEFSVAEYLRQHGGPEYSVLLPGLTRPYSGPFGAHGFVRNIYDWTLMQAASLADTDPSGGAWEALLSAQGFTHVLLPSENIGDALPTALVTMAATPVFQSNGVSLWALPPERITAPTLFARRDYARQHCWPERWILVPSSQKDEKRLH